MGGRGVTKNQYIRGDWGLPKKICRFKGGLAAPVHTMLKGIISSFMTGGTKCHIYVNKLASFNWIV